MLLQILVYTVKKTNLLHKIMTDAVTYPSICIPRTLANVTWKDVKDVFEKLIGTDTVERVDLVKTKNEGTKDFCRIFIHFNNWPIDNPRVASIRDRLLSGETIKLVYNNPWFWKCVVSNIPKPKRFTITHDPYIVESDTTNKKEKNLTDKKLPPCKGCGGQDLCTCWSQEYNYEEMSYS